MTRFSANTESFEERRTRERCSTRSMTLAKRSKAHNVKGKQKARETKLQMADEAGKKHRIERRVATGRKKKAIRHEGDEPRMEGPSHAPPSREAPSRVPAAEPRGNARSAQRAKGARDMLQCHHIPSSTAARRVPIRTRARSPTRRTVFVANLVPDLSRQMERKVMRLFADCGAILRASISVCPGTPMFHNALTGPHRVGAYQGSVEFLDDRSVPLALSKHLSVFEGRRIVVCRTPEELSHYYDRIIQAASTSKRSTLRTQPTVLLEQAESVSEVLTELPSPVEVESKAGRINLLGFSFGISVT
ncbi:hypothetical protein BKA70DRAFT_1419928 [Coprinopsis sp. MPI-PUGE-AT-0042]|nr:hypothetical protein BKA70DRAFT_1419928 [Coprinopsis sp. MPI-PUGE-AT-0042]